MPRDLYWFPSGTAVRSLKIQHKYRTMETKNAISSKTTVKELLQHYPAAGRVFIQEGLLCFGCPTESFHTLADVAEAYQLNLNDLIVRIQDAIQGI